MKEKIKCLFCLEVIVDYRSKKRRYCNANCLNKHRYLKAIKLKNCKRCKNEFYGFPNKKYCCRKCSSDERVDILKKIHEASRKYPKIEGLNRCQIYRKFNPAKGREELHKDNIKRVVLIQYLGGKCCKCGYDKDIRGLQLDHINGDGHEDRKKAGRLGKIYRYYVRHLEESKNVLQVLCAICHAIKSVENRDYANKLR